MVRDEKEGMEWMRVMQDVGCMGGISDCGRTGRADWMRDFAS